MSLLRLSEISLSYGSQPLLDQLSLNLERTKRLGLLGRNGTGKSTLLKVLRGSQIADDGERWQDPSCVIAMLDQTLPEADQRSVYEVVAAALSEVGDLLTRYHQLTVEFDANRMAELEQVQAELESKDGWLLGQRVDTVISQLGLPADSAMATLSGGWRKRVALACALVHEPDLLLLDEPTNHLDIPAIEWLEKQLASFQGALVLVTHDRQFLQRVCNHIAELDRGRLSEFDGDYHRFLRYRDEQLAAEEKANALFDKKLAQEEVWIRQGIKARRTRNEGRVRALKAMRQERSQRRELQGTAKLKVDDSQRSGKVVAELSQVSHYFGKPGQKSYKSILKNVDLSIQRGDRIGLIGANGTGKTTLLKILLGDLKPSSGKVKLGTKLEVVYFDQLRAQLEPEQTLIDNICGGQEYIEINGQRRHGISYLSDFLFSPERTRTPVKALSGGEQNRAILAKLFTRPANVLVLDEPTNDLDIETLELLEELLIGFEGTLLLVSHDRSFMDNVVTSVLVLEGKGRLGEYVGGYSDWVAQGGLLLDQSIDGKEVSKPQSQKSPETKKKSTAPDREKARRLSYKEQQELKQLPTRIEELEKLQQSFQQQIGDPSFYDQPSSRVQEVLQAISTNQSDLEQAYARWEELETLS